MSNSEKTNDTLYFNTYTESSLQSGLEIVLTCDSRLRLCFRTQLLDIVLSLPCNAIGDDFTGRRYVGLHMGDKDGCMWYNWPTQNSLPFAFAVTVWLPLLGFKL